VATPRGASHRGFRRRISYKEGMQRQKREIGGENVTLWYTKTGKGKPEVGEYVGGRDRNEYSMKTPY